jgi:hypothetical protein
MISFQVLQRLTGYHSELEYLKVRQPLGSEIRIDNAAAIQTSGDLQLVLTSAYRVFALPVTYACDGC